MDIENFPEIVYHGTISKYKESLKQGINLERGNSCVDFGKGFYVTTNYNQAVIFAQRLSQSNNSFQDKKASKDSLNAFKPQYSNPMIVYYKIDKDRLFSLNGYFFEYPDDTWAEFIYNNRIYLDSSLDVWYNQDGRYDFVYGFLADGLMATLMNDLKNGNMSKEEFIKAIKPVSIKEDQLSIHSETAVDCLKTINFEILGRRNNYVEQENIFTSIS